MKNLISFGLCILLLGSCGFIQIMPKRTESFEKYRSQLENDTNSFYKTVDYQEFIEPLADSTFLITWAPWCPHSALLLKDLQYLIPAKGKPNWVLICTSYDLEAIENVTKETPKVKPFCKNILDGEKYGSIELDRMRNISSKLIDSAMTFTPVIYFKSQGSFKVVNKKFLFNHAIK